MDKDPVLIELYDILELLKASSEKMYDILKPRMRTVLWRMFFPAGEFMGQKSAAVEAARMLSEIDSRLNELLEFAREKSYPHAQKIEGLSSLNFEELGEKLIELPPRAEYIMPQIDELAQQVESIIKQIEAESS